MFSPDLLFAKILRLPLSLYTFSDHDIKYKKLWIIKITVCSKYHKRKKKSILKLFVFWFPSKFCSEFCFNFNEETEIFLSLRQLFLINFILGCFDFNKCCLKFHNFVPVTLLGKRDSQNLVLCKKFWISERGV